MRTFRASKYLRPTVLLAGSVLLSYVVVSAARESAHRVADSDTESEAIGRPGAPSSAPFASVGGRHLDVLVITSSDCAWSTRPEFMTAIPRIRQRLRSTSRRSYQKVNIIGVAMDVDPDSGFQFLAELGNGKVGGIFDQVAVGGSWLNEVVTQFVWRENLGEAATPQVVIAERLVSADSYPTALDITERKLLLRLVGSSRIDRWVKDGMPLAK